MTVKQLLQNPSFSEIALPCPERQIGGVYIGDLLSWVMGRADADCAWITIMSNTNVIAVATLTDASCVILSEGVTPEDELVLLAKEKGVNLISSALPSYETAIVLSGVIS